MASDEFYKKEVGSKLNRDKIRLWEQPYTNADGSAGSIPQVSFTILSALVSFTRRSQFVARFHLNIYYAPSKSRRLSPVISQ